MTPERVASFGALVKVFNVPEKVLESARSVEDAASPVEESVVPLYVRPVPMRRLLSPPVEFPTRMPPSAVVEPVPPNICESEDVAETTPLIAWRFPVRVPMVRALVKMFVEVALVVDALVTWNEPGKIT